MPRPSRWRGWQSRGRRRRRHREPVVDADVVGSHAAAVAGHAAAVDAAAAIVGHAAASVDVLQMWIVLKPPVRAGDHLQIGLFSEMGRVIGQLPIISSAHA